MAPRSSPEVEERPRSGPELRSLAAAVAAIGSATTLEELLEVGAEEVRSLCGATSVSVSRWHPAQGRLRTLVNVGALAPSEERFPSDEGYRLDDFPLVSAQLRVGLASLVRADDPASDPSGRMLLRELGRETGLSVPIHLRGTLWGELYVTSAPGTRPLDLDDEPALRLVADQLAVAIERAELIGRLTRLAYDDPLTGLGNRRALEERLDAARAAAAASGAPLSVVLCDLDGLKELNDAHGHDAGDEALARTAAALTTVVEQTPGALVCRLGGDEFCLVLEDTPVEDARALAERARERLGEGPHPLDMSCGVASTRLALERPTDLLRAADAALYAAKRAGRGRVCVADVDPSTAWRAAGAEPRTVERRRETAPAADPTELLAAGLAVLDGGLLEAAVAVRLEALAASLGAQVDAAAVAVSHRRAGAEQLDTLYTLHRRSGHSTAARLGAVIESYPLAEYPATAALLRDRRAKVVLVDDPEADPAERALLREWGLRSLLAAASGDSEGDWLVEIYGDGATAELPGLGPFVGLLVTHAVHGHGPAAAGPAAFGPRDRPRTA